jgi:eukaryotic-like serine/threonine-protein kinase
MPDSIAHYRLGTKLGQGAMGEVYRATDTKLGRDVAIKLIAPSLTQDETRLASFTREAQVLASLNHPNIAAIYGVEDQALVMELVEGPTLADRIKQRPLSLEEALPIARQIADGLAAAHDRGIVHRDLKPANIKITPAGVVKLLDFGLAKAAAVAAVAAVDAATVAYSMAGGDAIAGTPAYMAPEQARGLAVDKRADIWAFGIVLYEMLTGSPPFTGETTTDILAAVVREEPDLTLVPPQARPVLRRCLEKDPKRRLRDVADAMLLLETAADTPQAELPAARRRWLPWAAAGAAVIAFAAVLAVHLREATPAADTVRFQVTLPPEITVTQTTPFSVSPNGRMIAFPAIGSDGTARVWLQSLDALEPRPLTTTELNGETTTLPWSRDSRSILYAHDQTLKRVDVAGGPPTVVVTVERGALFGLVSGTNGTILYGTAAGVMRTDESGATPTLVTKADPQKGILHAVLDLLPDGKHFLYTVGAAAGARSVYAGSVDVKPEQQDSTPLVKTDYGAVFVPSTEGAMKGDLLLVQAGTLVAQPFDAEARRVSGEPRPVAENVFAAGNPVFGIPYYSASPRTLVYRTGTLADRLSRQLALVGRDGKIQTTLSELGRYNQVKLSPDGSKVVTSRTELQTGNFADIWITDLATETSTKFTFGGGANVQPVWSPDGKYIAWARGREKDGALFRKSADGAGADELLYTLSERRNINISDWTADGRFLIYAYGGDVFALPVGPGTEGQRKPIPITATMASEFGATVSPNGKWIAYVSNETSRQELYVQPFAPGAQSAGTPTAVAGKWMVSNGTLGLARWRADSSELVFLNGDGALVSVTVTSAPVFKASAPQLLFQMPRPFLVQAGTPGALADASRDLQRFIIAMPSETSRRQELSVVLNWNVKR